MIYIHRLFPRILVIAGALLIGATAAEQTLYVFYPSVTRPQILQKQLSDELPGITITVFGRYVDFAEQVKAAPPDVILTKPDAIDQFDSYRLSLSGIRGGAPDEPCFLLFAKKESEEKETAALNLGAVDFLGRAGMDAFARKIRGVEPKLKLVTKVEDLLPLLTFGMADAVLVSAKNADYLAQTSNIKFLRKEASGEKVGIVGLGFKKGSNNPQIIRLFKGLSRELCSSFDIEAWSEP